MDEKAFSFAISGIAAAVFAVFLATIPSRRKKSAQSWGKLRLALPQSSRAKIAGIFVLCAAIIALIPAQRFALYIQIVLAAAALLGTRLAAAEAVSFGRAGIYENASVLASTVVFHSEILSLPTISYEDDAETVGVDKTIIKMILKNGRKIDFAFPDEETRQNALKEILSIRPELKV